MDYLSCWQRAEDLQVTDWPMVTLHQEDLASLTFEPLRTLRRDGLSGDALWVACRQDAFVGLFFGWRAIGPGVVAIVDTLRIATNALVLGENGVLAPSVQTAKCVRLVQSLPWRVEVQRLLLP